MNASKTGVCKISKSFPFNANSDISNINIFCYDNKCEYIISQTSEYLNLLSGDNIECLNLVSKATYKDSSFCYEFNTNNFGLVFANAQPTLIQL